MTDTEKRELDAWIAENLFDAAAKMQRALIGDDVVYFPHIDADEIFSPTSDSYDAMDVLKKCCEQDEGCSIYKHDGKWIVNYPIGEDFTAETLELAICLFSKKLFTK